MKTIISMSENDNFTILANTKWLLNNSMKDNMNAADIIIKIIAIENYYGKNDYGMNMYNKMQRIRVSKNKLIEREKAENEGEFIKLIKSFEENGYDKKFPVELNKNFEVFEGSHRTACSIYFNIKEIPVTFNKHIWNLEYDYSLKWFKENGMGDYIPLIKEKYYDIIK